MKSKVIKYQIYRVLKSYREYRGVIKCYFQRTNKELKRVIRAINSRNEEL